MKRIFLSAILIVAFYSVSSSLMAQTQTYNVINNTGMVIKSAWVSHGTEYKWNSNLIQKDVVQPNESFTFIIPTDAANCTYDFKYMTTDGKTFIRSGVNLCDNKDVAFTSNDKTYDEHIDTQYKVSDPQIGK